MYQVDLNSDLGESFGRYTIGNDEKIIPLITSANVACGYHASDPVVMTQTIQRAKEAGIGIGAIQDFQILWDLDEEAWQSQTKKPKHIPCTRSAP